MFWRKVVVTAVFALWVFVCGNCIITLMRSMPHEPMPRQSPFPSFAVRSQSKKPMGTSGVMRSQLTGWSGSLGTLLDKSRRTSGSIPKIIHTVWMANPLNPYFLASLDSVVQFMPDVTFKLHILTPSGANATVLSAIYSQFDAQLKPFLDIPGFDLRILLHDDVPSELIGTPLEGKGITQEHMGGTVEGLLKIPKIRGDRAVTPHGDHITAMIHASDFYRLLCVYRDGGLWMDTDHIFLQDIWPLLEMIGPFVYCEFQIDAERDGSCSINNSLFAATPGHPFLRDSLYRVVELIESNGVNGVFPIRQRFSWEPSDVSWIAVGPGLLTVVKERWLEENNDTWVVTEGHPHRLRLQDIRQRPPGVSYTKPTSFGTSLTILGRRYLSPTCWTEETLNLPMNMTFADMYSRAYSFHMWEYTSEKKKLRLQFVEIVRDKPESVLAHLFRKTCLMICDPENLRLT